MILLLSGCATMDGKKCEEWAGYWMFVAGIPQPILQCVKWEDTSNKPPM